MSPEENKMSLQPLDAKLGRSMVKDVYSFVNIIIDKSYSLLGSSFEARPAGKYKILDFKQDRKLSYLAYDLFQKHYCFQKVISKTWRKIGFPRYIQASDL